MSDATRTLDTFSKVAKIQSRTNVLKRLATVDMMNSTSLDTPVKTTKRVVHKFQSTATPPIGFY